LPGSRLDEASWIMDPPQGGVRISFGKSWLDADFVEARPGRGTVIFAHGSGSGRRSPRNRMVANVLSARGLGTLLLDLLTPAEARTDEVSGEYRFNIPLLTERLVAASDWLLSQPAARGSPIGFFGASTGGAVAMVAAAQRAGAVGAIVLRGARSDLGDSAARDILCPTLILVGEHDDAVRELNSQTLRLLRCEKQLTVIPGASHLFEEPGTLELVAERTADWFGRYLRAPGK